MSMYDILMLAVMVGAILFGFWKGLAWQIASISSIVVSYLVAMTFRSQLATYISAAEPWNQFAAMLILFLGTSLIIWAFYGYLKSTIHRFRLNSFDTQVGGILGAGKGLILCMLITLFAVTLFGSEIRQAVVASRSGGYLAAAVNRMNSIVPQEIHLVLDPHVQKFNQNLNETDPNFLPASEQKLNEKLQVFHGTFQEPANPFPANRSAGPSNPLNSGLLEGQKLIDEWGDRISR